MLGLARVRHVHSLARTRSLQCRPLQRCCPMATVRTSHSWRRLITGTQCSYFGQLASSRIVGLILAIGQLTIGTAMLSFEPVPRRWAWAAVHFATPAYADGHQVRSWRSFRSCYRRRLAAMDAVLWGSNRGTFRLPPIRKWRRRLTVAPPAQRHLTSACSWRGRALAAAAAAPDTAGEVARRLPRAPSQLMRVSLDRTPSPLEGLWLWFAHPPALQTFRTFQVDSSSPFLHRATSLRCCSSRSG